MLELRLTAGFLIAFFMLVDIWAQGPVAHYSFDNHFEDESGFRNHGIPRGGVQPATDRFGNPCGAVYFNGTDAYVEVPNSSSLQAPSRALSVTAWYNIDPVNSAGGLNWLTLVCKGDRPDETLSIPQYRVQTMQSYNQSTISINSEITEFDGNFRSHQFEAGKWHFYALIYNGVSIRVYMDDRQVWEFPYRESLVSNQMPLHIAKDVPGDTEFFKGALDDVRIFDRALNENEILALYHQQPANNVSEEFSLHCPNPVFVSTSGNSCTRILNYPEPELEIHCNNRVDLERVYGPPPGSTFELGRTLIAYTATSESGRRKACSFAVTVTDGGPPKIYCPADTVLYVDAPASEIVFQYRPCKASDPCSDVRLEMVQGIASGGRFPIGRTTNEYIARDANGLTVGASFTIEVVQRPKNIDPGLISHTDEGRPEPVPQPILVPTLPEPQLPEPDMLIPDEVTDTIIPIDLPELKMDTVNTEENPPDIIDYMYNLTFEECFITVEIFDNWEEDHDTVSIFFNDVVIVNRQMIKLRKNGALIRVIRLNPNVDNFIVSKAWNMGKLGKNTLQINFYHGDLTNERRGLKRHIPSQSKVLHSKPGLSAGIRLRCQM